MIKNIIFDWSGVISDDITPVYTAVMNVFEKLGLKQITLKEFKERFTIPVIDFYHKFDPNLTVEETHELFVKEIHSVAEPKPFNGAKEMLDFLKKKGINMILLSSHPQEKLLKELKDYDFLVFFTDINGSVKDKTEKIISVMEKNNFRPSETAYIGDMSHDIHAGKKAGVTTIAAAWGYYSKERLSQENPDFLVESFGELEELI